MINMWDGLPEGMGAVAEPGFLFKRDAIYYTMFLNIIFFYICVSF